MNPSVNELARLFAMFLVITFLDYMKDVILEMPETGDVPMLITALFGGAIVKACLIAYTLSLIV